MTSNILCLIRDKLGESKKKSFIPLENRERFLKKWFEFSNTPLGDIDHIISDKPRVIGCFGFLIIKHSHSGDPAGGDQLLTCDQVAHYSKDPSSNPKPSWGFLHNLVNFFNGSLTQLTFYPKEFKGAGWSSDVISIILSTSSSGWSHSLLLAAGHFTWRCSGFNSVGGLVQLGGSGHYWGTPDLDPLLCDQGVISTLSVVLVHWFTRPPSRQAILVWWIVRSVGFLQKNIMGKKKNRTKTWKIGSSENDSM